MDWQDNRRQFQKALIWVAAAMLVWILWDARDALLLGFGAILTAILLRSLAEIIAAWGRLPNPVSLVLATLLVMAIIGVTIWLFGSQLSLQFSGLMKQVEAGEQHLRTLLNGHGASHLGATITERGTSMITSMITTAASMRL